MKQIKLERVYLPTETLGSIYDSDVLLVKTMELHDKGNAHNISCIPEGVYIVHREAYTEKHPYPHFRVANVPNRDGILMHKITFVKDLLGCIGIGGAFKDLNGDGIPDMIDSSLALNKLYSAMPDEFELTITKKP
jgi:hypothetical protein